MKIKEQYKGAIIKDIKIGRPLEVNSKNLPVLLDFGHDYLIEVEDKRKEVKKKLKNDVKITKKRNKRNSSDVEGTSDA